MMALPFLFGNFHTDQDSLFRFACSRHNRKNREALSDAMMTYFSNFSKTGTPNSELNDDFPRWLPWSKEKGEPKRMTFDTKISMSTI